MLATEIDFFSLFIDPLTVTFLPAIAAIFTIMASSPESTNWLLSSGLYSAPRAPFSLTQLTAQSACSALAPAAPQ